MYKTLIIIGTGGFGREVLWAARQDFAVFPNDWVFADIFFVDDDKSKHGTEVCGAPVLGTIEDIPSKLEHLRSDVSFVCGIGSPALRESMVIRVQALPEKFSNFSYVRHPGFLMSDYVEVGEGSVLCAGGIATTQVKIGKHVNVNLDCTLGHDVVIEDFVNISPGVHISGYCTLKKGCDIGTGVNIIPGITIGEGSIVAAGATVIKDVPPRTLVAGVPATVKKEL